MTRSVKTLLPLLVAVVAAAAFWMLVLTPKREEIAKLDTQVAEQEAAIAQADAQAVTFAAAKEHYRVNYTKLTRLGKAVPGDDDVRSLLVQLDETARASKVDFRSLNLSGAPTSVEPGTVTTTPGALAPPPGTVPVGSAGFSAMPFSFSFTGSYFRLSDFFNRLEDFVTVQNDNIGVTGRLLLLGSIAVTPKGGEERLDALTADIGAAAYIVPPTESVPGAPAPATAGAVTPASTDPTSAPSTPPAATITGVR